MPDRFRRPDGTEVDDQRRGPDTGPAIQAGVVAGAAAGSAASVFRSAAEGPWWLKIASQATWGTIGAVMLFVFWSAIQEGQRQDRADRVEDRNYQRTEAAGQSAAVVTAIRDLKSEVSNRKAVEEERASDLRTAIVEMKRGTVATEQVAKAVDNLITEIRKDRAAKSP